MKAEDLLMAFTDLDDDIILDVKEIVQPRTWNRRKLLTVLIAAVLMFVLVGCTYAVLTEADWFKNFFAEQSKQFLSEKQADYIDQHTEEIAQSVILNGYTLTVESAIADQYTAYIKYHLQAPPGKILDATGGYLFGIPDYESPDYQKSLTREDGMEVAYTSSMRTLDDDDPTDDSVYILEVIRLQSHTDATFEDDGVWKLHYNNWDAIYEFDPIPETGARSESITIMEGSIDFDIVFTRISEQEVSLLTEPLPYSFITYMDNDAYLNSEPTYTEGYITSVVLRTMSAEITTEGMTDPAVGFLRLPIVMKDGSIVNMGVNVCGNNHYSYSISAPILLNEVDHILLPDGTKLMVPQE